jgi:hypothetical protein
MMLDAELVQRGLEGLLELLAPDDEHPAAAGAYGRREHVAQLRGVDRFGHHPLARELAARREHRHEHDRRPAQIGVGSNLAQDLETVHRGHEDVQRDRVVALATEGDEGLLAASGDGGVDVQRSWSAMSSATSCSSSTISTRRPWMTSMASTSSAATAAGMRTWNVVPRPGSELTSMTP